MCASVLDLNNVRTLLLLVSTPTLEEVRREASEPRGKLMAVPEDPGLVIYRLLAHPGWDSEASIAIAADELERHIGQMPQLGEVILFVHVPGFVRGLVRDGWKLEDALGALASTEFDLLSRLEPAVQRRGIAPGVLVTKETAAVVDEVVPSGVRVFSRPQETAA